MTAGKLKCKIKKLILKIAGKKEKMEKTMLYTPVTLWKDFNSSQLSTDKRIVKAETVDGIVYEHFYFSAEKTSDGVTRAYAVAAYPEGGESLPLVIFVNDAGCGVDTARMEYWAKSGYCAATVDCFGESDRPLFTHYPKSLDYANFDKCGRHLTNVDSNATETCWYHWTVNNRRLISVMLEDGRIDGGKVAIYSIHGGSRIVLQIVAMDERVKLGAVLYGNCWENVLSNATLRKPEEKEDFKADLTLQEERQRWLAAVSPQSYVPFVKVPFYIALGTNSTTTDIAKSYEVVSRMPNGGQSRIFLSPRTTDCGEKQYRRNLDKWFSGCFKGQNVNGKPAVEMRVENNNLTIFVKTTALGKVDKVKIFYSRGNRPNYVKNWIDAVVSRDGADSFSAVADVVNGDSEITVFCNALLESGEWISSNIETVLPSKLGQVDLVPKARILYDSRAGNGQFVSLNPSVCQTMDFLDGNPTEPAEGPVKIMGMGGTAVSTFALSDEIYVFDSESVLTFDVFSLIEQKMEVCVCSDFGKPEQKIYRATVSLVGGNLWQKAVVPLSQLKNETNRPIKEVSSAGLLSFIAAKRIIINNIVMV